MAENDFNKLNKKDASICALKSILLDRISLEKEFEIESYNLQMKFQPKFLKLHEKVENIIKTGDVTEKDCETFFGTRLPGVSFEDFVKISPSGTEENEKLDKFWVTVLKSARISSQMVTEADCPALDYLESICSYQTSIDFAPPGFPEFKKTGLFIVFHFKKNPFFTNESLYKFYHLAFEKDVEEPFVNDGLVPVKIETSKIEWLPEKNLTQRTVEKKQKNKRTKQIRVVTKTEQVESFFNFFAPVEEIANIPMENECEREMFVQTLMMSDYDFACDLHTEVIPKAVLYFTGELEDLDDSDEYGSNEDSQDSEECSDTECSSDHHHQPTRRHK